MGLDRKRAAAENKRMHAIAQWQSGADRDEIALNLGVSLSTVDRYLQGQSAPSAPKSAGNGQATHEDIPVWQMKPQDANERDDSDNSGARAQNALFDLHAYLEGENHDAESELWGLEQLVF